MAGIVRSGYVTKQQYDMLKKMVTSPLSKDRKAELKAAKKRIYARKDIEIVDETN
ncbi:MAG: hypothetical protein LKJ06_07800 [Schleiferilactobacillus harbinensis]|nr:hypothetical protein [Schleiferilactobacillus harbinensis]